MKAVIMAGGEGTRLRPVTGELPKPMAPLLGRPMLEHICAALKYRAEDIERAFSDGAALGVHMQYRVEREALGTAGGVKNCADFYGDEDFLVISGDAACDLDLSRLMREHREADAAATLALHRSREPLSYGLAVTDGDGDVRCFIEKPQWSRVVTDLVNTGIYILSPRAMALVPEGRPFDFAKELFPLLLARGERLRGVALDGYWCDVGTPLAYYRCCIDALARQPAALGPVAFGVLARDSRVEHVHAGNGRDRAVGTEGLANAALLIGCERPHDAAALQAQIALRSTRIERNMAGLARGDHVELAQAVDVLGQKVL